MQTTPSLFLTTCFINISTHETSTFLTLSLLAVSLFYLVRTLTLSRMFLRWPSARWKNYPVLGHLLPHVLLAKQRWAIPTTHVPNTRLLHYAHDWVSPSLHSTLKHYNNAKHTCDPSFNSMEAERWFTKSVQPRARPCSRLWSVRSLSAEWLWTNCSWQSMVSSVLVSSERYLNETRTIG